MTDILLFNQYFTSPKDAPQKIPATLPINLLYLASYIKKQGMDCKIYELGLFDVNKTKIENGRVRCGISDAQIINIINNEKPKIIALGCMYTRHYIDIISISSLIKKVDSSIKVVLGGNHASAFYEMVLKQNNIDYVVRGEGEITFYELCRVLLGKSKDLQAIKGIAYKNSSANIITNLERELVKNLDDLPLDYSLLDVKGYASVAYTTPFLMRYPAIGVISSRGCPGKCVYCTVKIVWGRAWRGKSPKNFVDELELLNSKYGIKEFSFLDDSISVNKKRWEGICDEIIERKLDIKWNTPNGIAHWTLDKQILNKMKKAGCYRVTFGIESGNVETRKFLGKPFSLSQAKEMIQYANKIGMWTICTNILGFPYETKEAMNETIRFAKFCGTDFATFFLLAPHVTSDVYKYFKKENLVDFDFIFKEGKFDEEKYEEMNRILDDRGTPTKYFSPQETNDIQMKAYKSFVLYRAFTFLNPLKILRKIRSREDLRYAVKLIVTGTKILIRTFYKKTTKALLYEYE